jgi:hypothetical protein
MGVEHDPHYRQRAGAHQGLSVPGMGSAPDIRHSGHFFQGPPRKDGPDSAFIQSVVPTGHPDSIDRPWRGIVTREGWKYVCLEGRPWMLFNLAEDPYELANHAYNSKFKGPRKNLHGRLAAWIEKMGDKFALPKLT